MHARNQLLLNILSYTREAAKVRLLVFILAKLLNINVWYPAGQYSRIAQDCTRKAFRSYLGHDPSYLNVAIRLGFTQPLKVNTKPVPPHANLLKPIHQSFYQRPYLF